MATTTDKAAAPTDTDSVSSLERMYSGGVVEARSASGQRLIGGVAAPFAHKSRLIGDFYEQIDNQFFTESRSQGWPMVLCRAEHSPALLLGTIQARTLELAVTGAGLEYECSLPPARQDVFEGVARGDYGGSSFTFLCTADEWSYRDGAPLRTLRSGKLREVGPVTVPAYPDASVAMRSLARAVDVPVSEIETCARSGELRRYFVRTDIDGGAPTMSAEQATALMEARRMPKSAAIEQDHLQSILKLHAQRMAWH
jgi:uncharacterized protein